MKISKFVHPVKKQPYCSYEMKNTGGNHYDKEKRYHYSMIGNLTGSTSILTMGNIMEDCTAESAWTLG